MSPRNTPPARNGKPATAGLAAVTASGRKLPTRLALHALEKWGKTSFAAHAPSPVFIQSRGETGLETLIDAGLLAETPHFPDCQTWEEAIAAVKALTDEPHSYRTVVIDTANGLSRLCEEWVCRRHCHGDPAEYDAYGRGIKMAVGPWLEFLSLLDAARSRRALSVILLTHTKVKNFKNPEGADFDRFTPDMPDQLWSVTHKWADAILFGSFVTVAEKERGASKAKGKGGQARVLYTQRTAAYDAGSRYALPAEIDCGNSPAEAWAAFAEAMKGGRAAAATKET